MRQIGKMPKAPRLRPLVRITLLLLTVFYHSIFYLGCTAANGNAQPINITSKAFSSGASIPKEYTADGANGSPAINWGKLPAGTKTLAMIVDDPDAPRGTWIHWVIYDIPASEGGLKANMGNDPVLANDTKQGFNSFGKIGYAGPQPPVGKLHHYYFTVYALDAHLNVPAGMKVESVRRALTGHILGFGQLMGTYSH